MGEDWPTTHITKVSGTVCSLRPVKDRLSGDELRPYSLPSWICDSDTDVETLTLSYPLLCARLH